MICSEEPENNEFLSEFSEVDTAFAEDQAALDYAYKIGLPSSATIRTLSPALLLRSSTNVEPADSEVPSDVLAQIRPATLAASLSIFRGLRSDPELSECAIAVAQTVIPFGKAVRTALALRPRDFVSPVVVVRGDYGTPELNALFNAPWSESLVSNVKTRTILAPSEHLPKIRRLPPETVNFCSRQRLGGFEKIGFQLLATFWRRMPVSSPRGTLLLLRENTLLRETALYLALRGFGLRSISPSRVTPPEISEKTKRKLEIHLAMALEHFFRLPIEPAGKAWLESRLRTTACAAVENYRQGLSYWNDQLTKLAPMRPKAVLTNMLMTPSTAALHTVCHDRRIPLAAFQHGVSREISVYNEYTQAYFESNTSDIFYAFNKGAAQRCSESEFNTARSLSVGLPAAYWRCGTYRRKKTQSAPIIYASTQLYAGNMNVVAMRGGSDLSMAKSEIRIIEEVLAKLPHPVLMKPYPDTRYPDADPVLGKARAAPNISIYEAGDDLSFLLPDHRVVVTARATSTVSWCVLSGKPLVFIDYPDDVPLRPEARRAFDAAFFVFDGSNPLFHEDLRTFLSRPIADIESDWEKRHSIRLEVIEEFFGEYGPGAGERAGRDLLNRLNDVA